MANVRLIFYMRGGENWANSCDFVGKDKPKSAATVGEIGVKLCAEGKRSAVAGLAVGDFNNNFCDTIGGDVANSVPRGKRKF